MTKALMAVSQVVVALGALLVSAQARTFTDTTGRKIEADLESYSDGKVKLRRGSKTFTVAIGKLSGSDQKYILKWLAANPTKAGYRFRVVTALKEHRSARTAEDGVMVTDKLKHRPHHYNVLVSNMSKSEAIDVEVRYEIYINDVVDTNGNRYAALAVGVKKRDKLQTIPGKLAKLTIPAGEKVEFDSDFVIQNYVDRDGGKVDQAASDKVIGIRLRIFKGDTVLYEYEDGADDARMRTAHWQDARAAKDTAVIR